MGENNTVEQMKNAIIEGDEIAAAASAKVAIKEGLDPLELIKGTIQPSLLAVGDQFAANEIYLPELMLAGDAGKAALDQIIPHLQKTDGGEEVGMVVALGTAYGDNHDIGKNIVKALLAANGFRVIDLGIDVAPRDFAEAVQKEGAGVIGISTLISTSLPYQRDTIQLLTDMGLRDQVCVILGGGPVTPEWAVEIEADGYGRGANDAVTLCKKIEKMSSKPPLGEPLIEGALKATKKES
jgi:methylmalonyl-CoA mutase cobalamin-binding domain/chain